VPRRLTKQLLCPVCGMLIGEAAHQRWPGDLTVTSVSGHLVQPTRVSLLRQLAEQDAVAATTAAERDRALNRLKFLRTNAGELVYDLACPAGHRMLVTMPRLVRAMRRTPARWVTVPHKA
jgi:hypothetical protein